MDTTTDLPIADVSVAALETVQRWPDGAPRLIGGTMETAAPCLLRVMRGLEIVATIDVPEGTAMFFPSPPGYTQTAVWYRDAWRPVSSGNDTAWRWRAPGGHVQIAGGPAGGVSVEWDRVHAACRAVDEARRGTMIGSDGISDIFGGSYHGPHYERRGLAGLVALVTSAQKCAHAAWDVVHDVIQHGELDSTRAAVRVAFAVHDLRTELARTGVIEYDPENTICGVTADGLLLVQGLRWIVGSATDAGSVPVEAALAYVSGGRSALAEVLGSVR